MKLRLPIAIVAALLLAPAMAQGATFKVNTLEDGFDSDGDCALREAVQAANANQAGFGCPKGQGGKTDTIELRARDYELLFISTNENANQNGDIDVLAGGPLVIKGKGSGDTSVNVNTTNDRAFDLPLAQSRLTLQGLQVASGDVDSLGSTEGRGGNVRSLGTLKLDRVRLLAGDAVFGGGVHANGGKVTLIRSQLDSNDAVNGGGGALASTGGSVITIKRSEFLGNDATSVTEQVNGGAIFHQASGRLRVLESEVQGSEVRTSGSNNPALGGALSVTGSALISRSTVSGNLVSASQDDTLERAGGVFLGAGDIEIVNSTFFNNRAGDVGDNDGAGGAIQVNSGNLRVDHVTFDSNLATAIGDNIAASSGTTQMFGSILEGDDPCVGVGIASAGFNVAEESDVGCGFIASDESAAGNLALGTLGENGGPTETIAIGSSSDARNFVPKAPCKENSGNKDQRGFRRPAGKKCDAGAFERGAQKP